MTIPSYEIVIRNGTVVDGSGTGERRADVAIAGGRIAAVGAVSGTGTEEIDASGKIVTPGFVDIHTHYDGQITWENRLAPSSDHGVTTVVMGNCGVGFAPVKPDQHDLIIHLMEGVEDIPDIVMATGVPWNWESFPDYLDALDERQSDIDFAAQLPHSPLRVYVMGQRGADLEPPTDADLAEMRRLTTQAIRAGALGVTTSRALVHRFRDGRLAPSVTTEERELMALAQGLRDAGSGVFQLIPNISANARDEFALIRRIHEASGRPISFTLAQTDAIEGGWRTYLDGVNSAAADGEPIRGQFFPRPVGLLFGLDLSWHPFALNPSYKAIAQLPLAQRVEAMRDPVLRARILAEEPVDPNPFFVALTRRTKLLFVLGDPPNYTPDISQSLGAKARAGGTDEMEMIYDALLEEGGKAILYCPLGNMEQGRLDSSSLLAGQPGTVIGLGDGGAHYGFVCDAGWPAYLLMNCVRDAPEDRRIPLARLVRVMSRDPAVAVGLEDRGLIAEGYKADLNIIDLDHLYLHAPRTSRSLPAGGLRLTQQVNGIEATIVSGQVTYRHGIATGHLPGRLVRGPRGVPA